MQGDLIGGRYRVEEEIGRGGMGIVLRALDTQLNRWVALKTLPLEMTNDAALWRRLASEARTASRLNHPGIAIVFDFVEDSKASFIVYELVAGRTLRIDLAAGLFSMEELVDAGVQLSDALAAAHDQGIMHRDLKPENIMVVPGDGRGRMKILDFGLAKHFSQQLLASDSTIAATTLSSPTAPGFAAGTIAYMAPEQLEGGQADARSDIYALGLVLYEMATGRHPFRGKSVSSTIANTLTQMPPPISHYRPGSPPEIDRIIHKCLRKRPAERYQFATELLTDLRNFRTDSALTDISPEPSPTLMRGFLGSSGVRPYRLWEILHLKAVIRCALLVYLAWRFRAATNGRWSLLLFFSAVVSGTIQGILSSVLLYAGAADRHNLTSYAQELAPWLRVFALANTLLAFVMAVLIAESHILLALLLTVLAVAIGFTALLLKPAMDRAAIFGSR